VSAARLETRAVLATGYRGGAEDGPFLTHAVEVVDDRERRALCGKVRPVNLADSGATDPDSVPTCPVCARRDPRRTIAPKVAK
jgi:hypothetical protein